MKWKLRKVDIDIKETLTCVLARSILIYIGTPMVAAGIWKRDDIDRTEAQLYRSISNLPNLVNKKALWNVACGLRNALDIVEPLALRTNLSRGGRPNLSLREEVRYIPRNPQVDRVRTGLNVLTRVLSPRSSKEKRSGSKKCHRSRNANCLFTYPA